jgi:hypothetical protein
MKLKVLPNELLIMIYKFSDNHTRLNMNKAFGWSFKEMNPFEEYRGYLAERKVYKMYIDSNWNECGFMKYLPTRN